MISNHVKKGRWSNKKFNSSGYILLAPEVMKGLVDLNHKWLFNWKNIGL